MTGALFTMWMGCPIHHSGFQSVSQDTFNTDCSTQREREREREQYQDRETWHEHNADMLRPLTLEAPQLFKVETCSART